MSQLGRVVPINLKDSENQAGKIIADPPAAPVKKNPNSGGVGDRVYWNNDSKSQKIVIRLRFEEDSWPFVKPWEKTIEIPIGRSSKVYTIAQSNSVETLHPYTILDADDKPIGESSPGKGDPGILVGD